MDFTDKLKFIDDVLARVEDWVHGQDGADITLARSYCLEIMTHDRDGTPIWNPKMVDWESAPEWANWHAVDGDGFGHWYECKPVKIEFRSGWYDQSEMEEDQEYLFDRYDWTETLTQRP